jgi:Zn-dependent M16 (insulinase) family peptidase
LFEQLTYDSEAISPIPFPFLCSHKKSGAQVMSVISPDENKVFGVTFRTPPADSTGIPHILEHSVLCGSKKFPVKEPFVDLLKGSLQNFLNAFTYPDRTCYPVASTNTKDFYNLVNVYLDAVLHPRAINDDKVLQQEGWHYELENPVEPLTYKGVVYNEMKGVYSSPGNSCFLSYLHILITSLLRYLFRSHILHDNIP